MENKKIFNFTIASVIFSIIFGTLLHFTYEFSGENGVVALFSAVNESVWEHLKLLFFPMLITTIIGYFYIGKDIPNYICGRALGILTAIMFVTIFFYTYTGIIGKNIFILDICSFLVGIILGEYISYKAMFAEITCGKKTGIFIIFILLLCFTIFTYCTPKINYFKDPSKGTYGIENNK